MSGPWSILYSGIFCSAYPVSWVEDAQSAPSCRHMRVSYTTITIYKTACVFGGPTMPLATTRQLLGGRHYMISQELARWYHQHHLHGRPAEHAGTLASPWEIATLYHLPGAGNTSCHLRVQQADHATCTLYDLPGAGTMVPSTPSVWSAC